LRELGLNWFNPDDWSRALQAGGLARDRADEAAWSEGQRRLRSALAQRQHYAFETTLGGKTVTASLLEACATHDVLLWYVGLHSVELHLERVRLRVASGGHSIPEAKIRERYLSSTANLIRLVPHVHAVQVYDNSRSFAAGEALRPPEQLAAIVNGRLIRPQASELPLIPTWAKAVVEAMLLHTAAPLH
jgi:predicted ABC-type ATPase